MYFIKYKLHISHDDNRIHEIEKHKLSGVTFPIGWWRFRLNLVGLS